MNDQMHVGKEYFPRLCFHFYRANFQQEKFPIALRNASSIPIGKQIEMMKQCTGTARSNNTTILTTDCSVNIIAIANIIWWISFSLRFLIEWKRRKKSLFSFLFLCLCLVPSLVSNESLESANFTNAPKSVYSDRNSSKPQPCSREKRFSPVEWVDESHCGMLCPIDNRRRSSTNNWLGRSTTPTRFRVLRHRWSVQKCGREANREKESNAGWGQCSSMTLFGIVPDEVCDLSCDLNDDDYSRHSKWCSC